MVPEAVTSLSHIMTECPTCSARKVVVNRSKFHPKIARNFWEFVFFTTEVRNSHFRKILMEATLRVTCPSGLELLIPFNGSSTVASYIKDACKRAKPTPIPNPEAYDLYYKDAALFEEDTLSQLGIAGGASLALVNKATGVTSSIPPKGEVAVPAETKEGDQMEIFYRLSSEVGHRRGIKVPTGISFKNLTKRILANEDKLSDTICLFFTDEMHLFNAHTKEDLLVRDIIKSSMTPLYVHFLPASLDDQKYTMERDHTKIFRYGAAWEPPVKQTPLASSMFHSCLHSVKALCSGSGVFNVAQLLGVCRNVFHFSPAVLALMHLFNGGLCDFEKHLLATVFYHLVKSVVPASLSIPEGLFLHMPVVWAWLLEQVMASSTETADYAEVSVYSLISQKLISKAATIEGHPSLVCDEEELKNLCKAPKEDQKQMLTYLKIDPFPEWHISPEPQLTLLFDVLHSYPAEEQVGLADYYIWRGFSSPTKSPIYAQWSTESYQQHRNRLESSGKYKLFTFRPPSDVQSQSLVVDKDNYCVFVMSRMKSDKSYIAVFHPCQHKLIMHKETDLLKEEAFIKLGLPISKSPDERPAEQVDMICFDVSASMTAVAFEKLGLSRFDVAKASFNAFVDKLVGYDMPHSVGVVAFGEELHEPCPLTREIETFEQQMGGWFKVEGATRIWDAILLSAQRLKKFQESHTHKFPELPIPKARILCLTDGGDTSSKEGPHVVARTCQDLDIVVDAIVLQASDQELIGLVNSTGGCLIAPNDQGGTLSAFQMESVLSLKMREPLPKAAPIGDRDQLLQAVKMRGPAVPQRLVPTSLHKEAQSAAVAKIVMGRKQGRTARIMKELRYTQHELATCYITADELSYWKILLQSPSGCPYVGGLFLLSMTFPEGYPSSPPEVRFVTPIYHCNINDDGKVCHQIVGAAWHSMVTVKDILDAIVDMLQEPNPGDALDSTKSALFSSNKQEYLQKAREWTTQHASKSAEVLKLQYKLQGTD